MHFLKSEKEFLVSPINNPKFISFLFSTIFLVSLFHTLFPFLFLFSYLSQLIGFFGYLQFYFCNTLLKIIGKSSKLVCCWVFFFFFVVSYVLPFIYSQFRVNFEWTMFVRSQIIQICKLLLSKLCLSSYSYCSQKSKFVRGYNNTNL